MATMLKAVRKLNKDEKLSPQAKVIHETLLEKAGLKKDIDRVDLVKEIKSAGTLETRQDVGRVVSYYMPRLVDQGLIEVTKTKVEKPAKEEKKAA